VSGPTRDDTIRAVLALVNAQRWSETEDILETHKSALWSAEADAIFADLLRQNADDAAGAAQITWRWDVLKAARAGGIPAAFARAQGRGVRHVIAAETLQALQTAFASGQQAQVDDVLDRHPELIPVLEHLAKRSAEGQKPDK
jgi:hypothetical protein